MPAHLRDLPRCSTCGRAATQMLMNAVNAPTGFYCDRCAKRALANFIRAHPDQGSRT